MGITKEQAGVATRAATFLTNADKGRILGFISLMEESDLESGLERAGVNAEDPPDVIAGCLQCLYQTKPSGQPLPLSVCLHYLWCIAPLDGAYGLYTHPDLILFPQLSTIPMPMFTDLPVLAALLLY